MLAVRSNLRSVYNVQREVARCFSSSRILTPQPLGPVGKGIVEKLEHTFDPLHLEVYCESHKHRAPPGSENHFKVLVVSDKFENLGKIDQHRMVNKTLASFLGNPVHALAIDTRTPCQWGKDPFTNKSPNCVGNPKK